MEIMLSFSYIKMCISQHAENVNTFVINSQLFIIIVVFVIIIIIIES